MRYLTAPFVALILLTAACQSDSTPAAPASAPPTTAATQIEHGGKVFAANCAKCHGTAGQGTDDAPQLVGAGALPLNPRPEQKVRKIPFHTAADIATFVTTSMPPTAAARKKLTEKDYWAVLAFALSANGVKLKEPVGPHNAASIVLHP